MNSSSLKPIFLFCLLHLLSCTLTPLKGSTEQKVTIDLYLEQFEKFRIHQCKVNDDDQFKQNLKAFRGQGYWIPELDGDVDVDTVKSLLPELEKKLKWIRSQRDLVRNKGLPSAKILKAFKKLLSQLLEYKKAEFLSIEKDKIIARQNSLKHLSLLLKEYEKIIKKVSFLSNYHFPVDHLKNRKIHEIHKNKTDLTSVKMSNYAFFYRKILEDGAYNKDHTSGDMFLRTTIDTLFYELQNYDFYLSEDARFDAEYVISKIDSELSKGKERILERLKEWEERTQRSFDFYRSLTLTENLIPSRLGDKNSTPNKELIKQHNQAAMQLKEFVYKRQAEVYQYWHSRPELLKAIFVLETILLNEVGGVDGDEALERMDVARVVMNRLNQPKYLNLGKDEFIYPYLATFLADHQIKDEKWLNALFKQGEFSFTYYYMSGVSNIFCPDISRSAKKLRLQNIEIATKILQHPVSAFKATRYFSRASMTGRIHMDSIWEDYKPYPERPGLLVDGQERLVKALEQGNYRYLYAFKDPDSIVYEVLEIEGTNYVLGFKNDLKLFYQYRSPHYFRYFTKSPDNTL